MWNGSGADARATARWKVDRAASLEKRDRRLDRCQDLLEAGADRRGRARKCDQQRDGERADESRVDPPTTRRSSNARTPSDRTVTIAGNGVSATRTHAQACDQRNTLPVLKVRPETIAKGRRPYGRRPPL